MGHNALLAFLRKKCGRDFSRVAVFGPHSRTRFIAGMSGLRDLPPLGKERETSKC
mgnify:CR=1 FL=1